MGFVRCSECDEGWVPDPDGTGGYVAGCGACGRVPLDVYRPVRKKQPAVIRKSSVRGGVFHGRWRTLKGRYVPGSYVPPDPAGSGSGSAVIEMCSWDVGSQQLDSLGSHIRREIMGSWRLYKGHPYKNRRPRARRPRQSIESEQELGKESDSYMEYLRDNPEAKWALLRENPEKFRSIFPDDYNEWYAESDSRYEDEVEEPLGK